MKKRCDKGKSCGATCIENADKCLMGLGKIISHMIGKARNKLVDFVVDKLERLERKISDANSVDNRLRRATRKFDKMMDSRPKSKEKFGQDFDWGKHTKDSVLGGRGAYGVVMLSKDVAVKRGEISRNEIKNLELAAEKGISPKLIGAELGRKTGRSEISDNLHFGRIAMERLQGKPIDEFSSPREKVGNTTVGDAYWLLRKRLHSELGIAHNDLHELNVFIDPQTGKAKAIDFGLSQKNPFAALAEALGPFALISEGDFQAKRPEVGYNRDLSKTSDNFRKMASNLDKVKSFLASRGLIEDEIETLIETGIRQPASYYGRAEWGKLSERDARTATRILYSGVR